MVFMFYYTGIPYMAAEIVNQRITHKTALLIMPEQVLIYSEFHSYVLLLLVL